MDYCHPCRRHLNGALACPGCGTPVEQPRVRTYTRASESPYGGRAPDPGSERAEEPPRGRADRRREDGRSRRDRKAAAHRRRRRRTILLASSFVLAAGGLSLAELGVDAPFSGQGGRNSAAPGDDSVDGGARLTETAEPLVDASSAPAAHTPASPSASDSGTAGPSASPDEKPTKQAGQHSAVTGHGAATPAQAATTAAAPTGHAPATHPAPSSPPPHPSPSQTCKRFLWWCT